MTKSTTRIENASWYIVSADGETKRRVTGSEDWAKNRVEMFDEVLSEDAPHDYELDKVFEGSDDLADDSVGADPEPDDPVADEDRRFPEAVEDRGDNQPGLEGFA